MSKVRSARAILRAAGATTTAPAGAGPSTGRESLPLARFMQSAYHGSAIVADGYRVASKRQEGVKPCGSPDLSATLPLRGFFVSATANGRTPHDSKSRPAAWKDRDAPASQREPDSIQVSATNGVMQKEAGSARYSGPGRRMNLETEMLKLGKVRAWLDYSLNFPLAA